MRAAKDQNVLETASNLPRRCGGNEFPRHSLTSISDTLFMAPSRLWQCASAGEKRATKPTFVHNRILVAFVCASLINLSHHSCNTVFYLPLLSALK